MQERADAPKPFMKAMAFSVLLHGFILLLLLVNVNLGAKKHRFYDLMEVTLMEMPSGPGLQKTMEEAQKHAPIFQPNAHEPKQRDNPVEKAPSPKSIQGIEPKSVENKVIPIAKREVSLPRQKVEEETFSRQMLNDALQRLRDRVRQEQKENEQLEKSIAHLQERLKKESQSQIGHGTGTTGAEGASSGGFTALDIYKAQITNVIWNNWSFPVDAYDEKTLLRLEAILRIKVDKSGKVNSVDIVKRSRDQHFDNSILRAIEKSNPLPPLPAWYQRDSEEIEVRFSLKELIANN